MNYRQAKLKGQDMFYYYDYPTTKKGFKKLMKRKSRVELKKDLHKERMDHLDK